MISKQSQFSAKHKHFFPTYDEVNTLRKNGTLTQAGLYQVTGPHFRDVYYIAGRPFVYTENARASHLHAIRSGVVKK